MSASQGLACPRPTCPIAPRPFARPEELRLRGAHLTERYQQIFIIALGELLFSAGLVYSRTDKDLLHPAAFLVVFAATVLIGLSYVTPAGTYLGAAIEKRGLSWFSTLTGDLHLVMIAGVLAPFRRR